MLNRRDGNIFQLEFLIQYHAIYSGIEEIVYYDTCQSDISGVMALDE